MTHHEMIQRAKELAVLASEISPSTPWHYDDYVCRVMGACGAASVASFVHPDYGQLLAAAPEMAELLGKMADALQEARNRVAYYEGRTQWKCEQCGMTCIGDD